MKEKKKPPVVEIKDNPFHSWARVELWRWQYGELPQPDDERELDVPVAVEKMVEALTDETRDDRPGVFNCAQVLSYLGHLIGELVKHPRMAIPCTEYKIPEKSLNKLKGHMENLRSGGCHIVVEEYDYCLYESQQGDCRKKGGTCDFVDGNKGDCPHHAIRENRRLLFSLSVELGGEQVWVVAKKNMTKVEIVDEVRWQTCWDARFEGDDLKLIPPKDAGCGLSIQIIENKE